MAPGIVAAMTSEGRMLASHHLLRSETAIRISTGALLVISGIGAERARRAALLLVENGATALVSWGTAAALAAEAVPGEMLVPIGIISRSGHVFTADRPWHASICARLERLTIVKRGILAESVTVLRGPAEKKVLFEKTGALAADMESAAVAAVADEYGFPFAAIRAVADGRETMLARSALNAIDDFGNVHFPALLRNLAANPADAVHLWHTGRNYRCAIRTLTIAAGQVSRGLLSAAERNGPSGSGDGSAEGNA